MDAHPAAALFPLMSGEEFDAFVADIKAHGLREPIVMADGKVLDGRNRLRACEQLGIKPSSIEWDGNGTPEEFVVSENLHRRHLNASQRGMIAARLPLLRPGNVVAQQCEIGNSTPSQPVVIANETAEKPHPKAPISSAKAAAALKVNRSTVLDAKLVLASANAEDIAQIDRGELSVNRVASRIRKGVSEKEHHAAVQQTKERTTHQQRVKAEIWNNLRSALERIAALPKPADTAAAVGEFTRRFKFPLKEKVARAQVWLREFEDAINAQ